ncbi:MAG: DUF2791 family P-loop domain-containing protein [Nitrospira sp.]|nr:DUF2791 family P-loop domain-containing protein [Nitrospira sp.]
MNQKIACRRAIEALRSGVPNRDAVRSLGCEQPAIEHRFLNQLKAAKEGASEEIQAPGLLISGDFGTGKSHLLEYLQHLAIEENFVCSKIVISKETPLHDPVKLYRSAIETAMVPDKRGSALTEIAAKLDMDGEPYRELDNWVHNPSSSSRLNSRFAASLFLYRRMGNDMELRDRIISFWAGDPMGSAEIKKHLRECGEKMAYKIEAVNLRDLAIQRFQFTSRLITAAGYSGWVLLIDETELIGRYSFQQRAKSYAELARWMGKLKGARFPGLTAVFAITKDFKARILEEKEDIERIPAKLRLKATEPDLLLASQAERGMRLIQPERDCIIKAPDTNIIEQTYRKIRTVYTQAYNWEPPLSSSIGGLTSTSMREYVKGWITEWDLKRLDPQVQIELEFTNMQQDYSEDKNLETAHEEEGGREE